MKCLDNRTEKEADKLADELASKVRALMSAYPGATLNGWDDGGVYVSVEYGAAGPDGWRPSTDADV